MKKSLLYFAIASMTLFSCKNDDDDDTVEEVSNITEQNSNDDAAILKYMDEHYLDSQGNIKTFSSTDTTDDNYTKLSGLNFQKLSSGVIVIVRDGAQPDPGTTIGTTDIIRLMHKTTTFVSTKENNEITYTSEFSFANTIESGGVPQVDPAFYYVKQSVMDDSDKGRSYYEIEGFQEGLKYFKSFDKADSENYNLQGIIIVPSRAAFARDSHYPYSNISWRNRTFIFDFQVYKTTAR